MESADPVPLPVRFSDELHLPLGVDTGEVEGRRVVL